ncbi:endonuclease domain-containing protein [Micromonospora echinofusca]|uniref:endonuclease domain-containing protein n=1 Tax=Micromonospora echinofusca TaxID=47858 RepID=UPI0033C4CB20
MDHCHNSRQVRGLLCGECKIGLGAFKDSPEALMAAARYLVAREEATPVRESRSATEA